MPIASPPPPENSQLLPKLSQHFRSDHPQKINHALSKNLNPLKYVNNQLPPPLTQTTSFLRILSFLFDLFFITFQKQLMLYFCFGGGGGRIRLIPPEPTPPPKCVLPLLDMTLAPVSSSYNIHVLRWLSHYCGYFVNNNLLCVVSFFICYLLSET